VENFIDATHFPFVHAGLNGVMDAPDKLEDYTVSKGPDGLATSGIKVYQPYGDHRQVPVFAEYRYRCMRPNAAYFSKSVCIADPKQEHRGGDNDRFCTFLTAQPLDEVTCIIRLAVAINFGPELTEADILRRQDFGVLAGSRDCRDATSRTYPDRPAAGTASAFGPSGSRISALAQGAWRHLRHTRGRAAAGFRRHAAEVNCLDRLP